MANETYRLVDFNLPDELFGVDEDNIYKYLSLFIMCAIGLAATHISTEVYFVMLGVGIFFDKIMWLTGVPWWLWTTFFVLGMLLKFSERRSIT
jgi:hypothetical protein